MSAAVIIPALSWTAVLCSVFCSAVFLYCAPVNMEFWSLRVRSRPRTYLKPADELVQRAVRLVSGLLHGPEVGVIPLGYFHVILCMEKTDPRTMSMHRKKTCFVTCPHPPSAPCLLARVLSAPAASLQAETSCSRDGGSTGVTSLPLKQQLHGPEVGVIPYTAWQANWRDQQAVNAQRNRWVSVTNRQWIYTAWPADWRY